ncbi:PREDICTED: interferon alpha-inducible protein 27, mitochondrial-like isoform X4 [Bison bison bison]|uniref:Interferon alpha-inducible protein 27, mitochondrial-like isoform X4 n=1 Tax=Bison bison bison TaxID=43346 RepID=A0A6P3H5U5_BISBB|nr:PREDICTED: interferon alpha-inducible protein 27, mitochondrial-like isoform X4 [Bison bison bison]
MGPRPTGRPNKPKLWSLKQRKLSHWLPASRGSSSSVISKAAVNVLLQIFPELSQARDQVQVLVLVHVFGKSALLGLTLPSSTALAGATSTLGSLVGTLKGSFLLGSPAAALSTLPVGAKAAAAVVGGASTVAAVPMVLSAVGFTSAGITASSLAAKMMSISAIANGGGVAAGSLVATLQSVGASGLCLSSKLLVGIAGSTLVSKFLGL